MSHNRCLTSNRKISFRRPKTSWDEHPPKCKPTEEWNPTSDSSAMLSQLIKHFKTANRFHRSNVEARLSALEKRVSAHDDMLSLLVGGSPNFSNNVADPLTEWLANHQEITKSLVGKHFAFHAKLGILAIGDSISDVYKQIKDKNLGSEVSIERLPVAPA